MTFHAIQSSFAGGEISPAASGRVDIEKYKTSLKTMRNFLPGIHGEASNRPGTFYIANNDSNNNKSRLIPFIFSQSDAVLIELCGSGFMNFFANGVKLGFVDLPHPYTDSEIFNVKYCQSANVLYLVHPNHPPQILTRISNLSWTIAAYGFINGPFLFPNVVKTQVLSNTLVSGQFYLTSVSPYFQPTMAGTFFKLSQDVTAVLFQCTFTYPAQKSGIAGFVIPPPAGVIGPGFIQTIFPCGNTWRFATTGTWEGTINVEQSLDDGVSWSAVYTFVSQVGNPSNANTTGTVDLTLPAGNNGQPPLFRVNVITLTSGTLNIQFGCDAFTYQKIVTVGTYLDSTHMLIVAQTSPTIAIRSTYLWSEGAWSNYRGWPSIVTFTQDRLVFAATPTEPDTIYMTRTSNYIDFGISDPLVDSDAIDIQLLSRQVNPIKSLVSFLNMLVSFTGLSEFSVTSTSGAALTPTTIFSQLQGTRGTGNVDPILIGNKIVFLEPQGSCLREMTYQYFTGILDSRNVSLISDHLFRDFSIVDMAYQQEPDSVLWLVRSDGTLLSFTYLIEQQFESWARHDATGILGGEFESVACIPGVNGTEVWFVVKRNIIGKTPQRFIERMLPRGTVSDNTVDQTSLPDQFFVDAGVFFDVLGGDTVNMSHLTGMTVSILADGVILPQQVVANDGTITVPDGTSVVAAGLPITSDLETLDQDFPRQDGTSQGRKYRIGRATLKLLDTSGVPFIGPDLNTLSRMKFIDTSVFHSGFTHQTLDPAEDLRGHVAIRHTDPTPITLLQINAILEPV